MKNLKKVLALVLTVAMVLSFTIAAGAFSDTTTYAKNTEAVDVMSMLKVINGYTDGSFKGDKSVTRAEMAKMICYIIASGDDVGSIYAGANTFTDCTSHWAKGYIAYAAKTGLVAGIGKGKFDPNGNVTGTQAAKMLLCALGYSATNEKYVGANWDVNVLAKAEEIGLLDNLTATDMSKALTRADAAQMMFNALTATMVKYTSGGTTVTTSDGTVVTTGASTAENVSNTLAKDYRYKDDSDSADLYMQLCEKYFPDLTLDISSDSFERPADIWDDGDGNTVTAAETPDVTYTAEVKGKQIYSDLGKTTIKDIQDGTYTVTSYRNGEDDTANVGNSYFADITSTDTNTYNENGLLTEVYVDSDSKKVTVVMIDTILAQVDSIDDDDTSNLEVTFNALDSNITIATATEDDTGLDFSKLAEDDYVLLTGYVSGSKYEVASVAAPKTVSGTMSAFKTDSSVTLGGTKYTMQNNFDDVDSMVSNSDFNSTYTLYLDSYGYAIGSTLYEEAAENATYLYVSDTDADAYGAISGDAYVKVAAEFTDGTSKVVNLYVKNATKSTATYYIDGDYEAVSDSITVTPGWYSYSTTSDGYYKLDRVATSNSTSVIAFQHAASALDYSGTAKIATGVVSLSATSSSTLNLIDSSKSYTGYKNFPDRDNLEIDSGVALYVKTSKTGSTLKAIYIYGEDGVTSSATIAYYAGYVGADSDGSLYGFYVGGKYVTYYDTGSSMSGLSEGEIVSLDIDDTDATATDIRYTQYSSTYGTYKVAYCQKVYAVESSDYFSIYNDPSDTTSGEGSTFYLSNDDEDITCAVYNAGSADGSTMPTDTLSKKDSVTVVYVNISGDYYAVAAFVDPTDPS